MTTIKDGLQLTGITIALNVILASFKIVIGIVGNSYALVADGIESTMDVVSSLIVWSGLRIASRPADSCHPYGHGKAESLAGVIVALSLIGAAVLIAVQSIRELMNNHYAPAWYTLFALVLIIGIKETMYRYVIKTGNSLNSTSLKSDAWHHRSDALTSVAAFIGISIALIGGEKYAAADDWAALLACFIILYNGYRLLRPALDEVMDAAVPEGTENEVREIVSRVEGVIDVEKCRIRKSGFGLIIDIHVIVDGSISVKQGHDIAHLAKDRLGDSQLMVSDVTVHIEPDGY